jgi:hypothetical protein
MRRFVSLRRNGALTEMPTAWLFLGILAPAAAFLCAVRFQPWVSPAELVGGGFVASVASLLWIGTASICLFTAAMLYGARGNSACTRFLLAAGLATLWLGLDDAFALHRDLLPVLGIPAALAPTACGAVGALYLLAAWRAIVANRPSLLIAAGLFLAAAVNAERIAPEAPDLAEAGLTFLAVAFWAGFHVLAAARIVEELATGRITAVALSSARLVRRA